MSKISLLVEFDSEQAAMAFLASRGGGMPASAPPAPPPYTPPAPPPTAPPAYQAPPPAAPPAYQAPPPAAPAPTGGNLPQGVPYLAQAENGQPWSPTAVVPLMQAYANTHQSAGLQAVFQRYGLPQNVLALNAQQLAMLASHLKSNAHAAAP